MPLLCHHEPRRGNLPTASDQAATPRQLSNSPAPGPVGDKEARAAWDGAQEAAHNFPQHCREMGKLRPGRLLLEAGSENLHIWKTIITSHLPFFPQDLPESLHSTRPGACTSQLDSWVLGQLWHDSPNPPGSTKEICPGCRPRASPGTHSCPSESPLRLESSHSNLLLSGWQSQARSPGWQSVRLVESHKPAQQGGLDRVGGRHK